MLQTIKINNFEISKSVMGTWMMGGGGSSESSKTPAQIALNWPVAKPNVGALPKVLINEHVDENFGAPNFELEKEDVKLLDITAPNKKP